ncbi:MAG: DUF971 domain-containing protein [Magnetococcales bacterium]|nr:DUF971 domain-containing protein [Magnetococcales bacterium]
MGRNDDHIPTEIRGIAAERRVVIGWESGEEFSYPMEYLRVGCPCADCRGHMPSQRKLIFGKRDVTIETMEAVGHYAIKIHFSDGHDTGVYSWGTLYELGAHQERFWADYLEELKAAGKSRVSIPIVAV